MEDLFPGDRDRLDKEEFVILRSSEAEFVVAGQVDQEVGYLRVFLTGFVYTQKNPTEIWEDTVSCIMMSENRSNRDRCTLSP